MNDLNQMSYAVCFSGFRENSPRSQKVPSHPGLHPWSQTPLTALQLIQLDSHLSMQFLPNDPFIQPKENQTFKAKGLSSKKIG